jgi:hypothetical protein
MTLSDDAKTPASFKAILARRCLQLALVMFVIGIFLALLAQWGERRATANAAWRNPGDTIELKAVAPDLAALSLAGVPDAQVLTLSIALGELETTRAILAFGADLSDKERSNGWLWLADRYHQANQMDRAAHAYRLAGDGAILGTNIDDLLRTKILLAVGQGLLASHDKERSRFYLSQSAIIGGNSNQLGAYHRHTLLEQLVPAILQAGGYRDDWKNLAETTKRVNAGVHLNGSVPTILGQEGISAAPFAQAQDARREAAAVWLATITEAQGDGQTDTNLTRVALVEALREEDSAVNQYVTSGPGSAADRLAAQETLLHWLLLKRRIAGGGLGTRLIPEWEDDREEIEESLSAAWREWLALQSPSIIIEETTSLPFGISEIEGVAPEAARLAIAAAYWGLYSDAPVPELLSAAQARGEFGGLQLTILEPGEPPVVGWSR